MGCRGVSLASLGPAALPQVNRFRKRRDRALLLTDRHLYKLDPGRQYRVMRSVPLDTVSWGRGPEWGGAASVSANTWAPGSSAAFVPTIRATASLLSPEGPYVHSCLALWPPCSCNFSSQQKEEHSGQGPGLPHFGVL